MMILHRKLYISQLIMVTALFIFGLLTVGQFYIQHPPTEAHYIFLAQAFLHGSVAFVSAPGFQPVSADLSIFNNYFYWPLGPLPTFLFMPFVSWLPFRFFYFLDAGISIALHFVNMVLVFFLARSFKLRIDDAWHWVVVFLFSSPYIFPLFQIHSSNLALTLACALLLASLLEYQTKRRWWLIGICSALAMAARITTAPALVAFFILALYGDQRSESLLERLRQSKYQLLQLLFPIVIVIGALGWYNYIRFGVAWETGYRYQSIMSYLNRPVFHFTNVKQSFFNFFVKVPTLFPSLSLTSYGLSIFILAPYTLRLFSQSYKNIFPIAMLVGSSLVVIGIFFTIGGFYNHHNRYGLDAFPYILALLLYFNATGALRQTLGLRVVFYIGIILNLILVPLSL